MNLRNMSVGGRVGATLALVSGLFIVAVLIGWQGIGNVVTRSGAAGAEAGAAHAAAAAAYNMRLSQAQAVLNGGRVENADGSDTHRGDVAAFEKALEELHAVTHPDEYRDIKRAYATWTRTDERLRSLTAAGRHVAAVELVNGAGNEKGDTLATALSAIGREATNGAADAAVAQARAAHRKMLLAVLVALAGAALATLTLIRRLRRATGPILNRLNMLRDHCTTDLKTGLEAMAQGDLTIPITPVTPHIDDLGDDELGQIARAVNEIRDRTVASVEAYNATRASLSAIVADVAATADDVAGASTQMAETSQDAGRAVDEIAHAVGEVAQGAERQVRAVELVRGASTEMTAVTTDSSERVQEAARVAADTARLAAAGTEAIGRATTAMGSVREASEAATTAIQALGAKSDRIGDIVSAITRIAEQTNLLALNAAIEAARAGDHGRGFAVVADEVRKLAEESQTAAGSIGSLVEEIQAETRQAVRLVESGGERTHEGVGTVDEARTAFAAIGAEVERINEQVEHIAAAVEQIAATSARVDSEVGDVAAVAEQTSASSQQVSASAEETSASTQQIAASAQSLAETADRLRQSVATFTLAT